MVGSDSAAVRGRFVLVFLVLLAGEIFQPVLAIIVHPQSNPGHHGVEGNPRYWRRYSRQGILIGSTGLHSGFAEILGAVRARSSGRVPIT